MCFTVMCESRCESEKNLALALAPQLPFTTRSRRIGSINRFPHTPLGCLASLARQKSYRGVTDRTHRTVLVVSETF
jgi:hypothetical protein